MMGTQDVDGGGSGDGVKPRISEFRARNSFGETPDDPPDRFSHGTLFIRVRSSDRCMHTCTQITVLSAVRHGTDTASGQGGRGAQRPFGRVPRVEWCLSDVPPEETRSGLWGY